jgi:hypothetical protein
MEGNQKTWVFSLALEYWPESLAKNKKEAVVKTLKCVYNYGHLLMGYKNQLCNDDDTSAFVAKRQKLF